VPGSPRVGQDPEQVVGDEQARPPGTLLSRRLAAALGRRGVELLDYSRLVDFLQPEYHFAHDWHPTAPTNRVIAEQLVADLGLAAPVAARAEGRR
jgi:hypothetical protein